MNRERILSILYDLSMVVGGEVNLRPLLTRTLQRLLYHTSFPAGVVLLDMPQDRSGELVEGRLELAVGDFELAGRMGTVLSLPAALVDGSPALLENCSLVDALPARKGRYTVCLRLPVGNQGVILLFSPVLPATDLPLTQIFQPVMANLDKAILLCRRNEAFTHTLISDRDQARSGLERFRAALDASADSVFLIDPRSMAFVDFNRSAEIRSGYGKEELLGMGPQDLSTGFDRATLPAMFDELLRGQRPSIELDTVIRRRGGSEFPADIQLNLFTGAGGKSWSLPWPGTSPSASVPRRSCARSTGPCAP